MREVFAFGRFQVNVATRECTREGERVPLTAKMFDTLVVLLRHHDRVVTKDELMKAVWHDVFVSDDSLTQVIKGLRRLLGDHATHPAYIVTVSGRGYRFVAPVQLLAGEDAAAAPEAMPRQAEAVVMSASTVIPRSSGTRTQIKRLMVAVALAVLAGLAGYAMGQRTRTAEVMGPLYVSVEAPEETVFESGPVLSPDGRLMAFVATSLSDRRTSLWIRDLTTGQSRSLENADGASRPFWSPDGRQLAFFAAGALRVVPVAGGVSRPVVQARSAGGGHWGESDILFSEGRSPVRRVSPAGGEATAVTALDISRQEVSHRWPLWLPDGNHFLFFIESANPEHSGTYVASLDGRTRERLLDAPAVHAPGHLVFVQRRVLYAQRFDESTRRLIGEPVAPAAGVAPPEATTGATISVSREGKLAYGGSPVTERFVWVDREGREIGRVNALAGLYNPRLLSDGSALLAATGAESGRRGIWLIDLARGEQTRLTEGMRPLASPEGTTVVFTTDRATGRSDIYMRTLGGEDKDHLLVQSPENKVTNDWSPDGQFLVYASFNSQTRWDLWTLPMRGERTPRPFLQTPFNESQARISPSGRWLAYNSDETGRYEVYLQAFPQGGSRRAVSVGGGTEPLWRPDERELFYIDPERRLIAVEILETSPLRLGTPFPLFQMPLAREGLNLTHYDVSPDGKRFLVHAEEPNGGALSARMLINWTEALARDGR